MLRNLHVKNLALIDEAEVDFTSGLNILTGETGAGKSIVIGSINLALGEKISKEMLRGGDEPSLVELIFDVPSAQTRKQLEQMGITTEEDCLIMSRRIAGGRSVARINAESVPVSKMREVASLLIDIHGQHEHQSLLKKKKHLEILDDYAKEELDGPKEKLREAFVRYQSVKKELSELSEDEASRRRELSLLEYEVDEIEAAALCPGEDARLEADFTRMSNGRKIMEALGAAQEMTSSMTDGASERIGRALRELSGVEAFDDALRGLTGQLSEVDNLLNDFNREIADYISDTSFDEETFAETERRLDLVNHLKAKYGSTVDEILKECGRKKERLEKLADYDAYLNRLQQEFKTSEQEVKRYSDLVSDIRKEAAGELTQAIISQLKDLNFPDVSFSMDFKKMDRFTANGYDDAEFLISANPGEPQKSLEKIASGGELSRIMLAMKSVLADTDAVGTLIFDEIDTGISGRTAQMVSEKMNALGRSHQIICITHLPQIAAMADSHYVIEKSVENQTTISTIRPLSQQESIGELARMLGGVKITDTVYKSAEEMKELAANTKKTLGEP